MSLYTALMAGVSGLNANASAMAALSDNIANLNTVGFKRNVTDFSALINAQPGQSNSYNAGGVLASARRLVDLQGSLVQSSSSTDLAVSGDGFFIVTDDPELTGSGGMFTRAGAFQLDADGRLVNAQGLYLLGAPIDPNRPSSGAPATLAALQPITLSGVGSDAEQTTRLAVNANLDSRQVQYTPTGGGAPYAAGAMAAGTIIPDLERTVEIYDSLGAIRTLSFAFKKIDTPTNQWALEITYRPDPAAAPAFARNLNVTFNTNGSIATITDPAGAPVTNLSLNFPAGTFPGAAAQDVALDIETGLSQYAIASAFNSATADGSPPGNLVSVNVDTNGVLTAQFSNGRNQDLYQIPVATFLNPNGLVAERAGAFRQSIESGLVTINTPGQGGAGAIQSFSLENSNVDLGVEFTGMITTQRAYSASSKIITTADEMLEELIRIKR